MRSVLKILLVPAAISLAAASAGAAPANLAAPAETYGDGRADQNVIEVGHKGKHWRKGNHWRKKARREWRHWKREHAYRPYWYGYYPRYYYPRHYYYRPYYGPSFSVRFGIGF